MSDLSAAVVITIDGPSGVGKSTISKKVASKLGFTYLDTGAMYRAVALHINRHGLDFSDVSAVERILDEITIDLLPAVGEEDVGVLLNGEDVSGVIRTPEMSMLASRISALPAVRAKLTRIQQEIGSRGSIVAEGRDTGTVVFPHAACKFYLDATPWERTHRRALQLRARGEGVDEKELLEMTITRDKNDSERVIAPLKKAKDAVIIDTTAIPVEQVMTQILGIVASIR